MFNKPTSIGIDIDGVIWDLLTPWIKKYNRVMNETIDISEIKEYNISKYVKNPHALYYLLEWDNFWDNMELYDGVYETIEKLNSDPNVALYIVTSTSYNICNKKFNKLLELLPMLDKNQIVVTQDKTILCLDWLIDDWENNLKLGYGKKVLVNQTYNENFPNELYSIPRVDSLKEAIDYIIKKEGD